MPATASQSPPWPPLTQPAPTARYFSCGPTGPIGPIPSRGLGESAEADLVARREAAPQPRIYSAVPRDHTGSFGPTGPTGPVSAANRSRTAFRPCHGTGPVPVPRQGCGSTGPIPSLGWGVRSGGLGGPLPRILFGGCPAGPHQIVRSHRSHRSHRSRGLPFMLPASASPTGPILLCALGGLRGGAPAKAGTVLGCKSRKPRFSEPGWL